MSHENEILTELISSIEILEKFYEPPETIFPQFVHWINHVSSALEAAEMEKELLIWKRTLENVSFSVDESSFTVQMSSLKTILKAMQKKYVKENGKDELITKEPFIAYERINELSAIHSSNFDLTKLIELCKELNYSYAGECYLAVAMIARAILDHVPPIFGVTGFSEVASNYRGSRSFKESMAYLDKSSRKIADSFLHTHIRNSETLPTKNQVSFVADLDVLLSEIVRILK